MQEDNYAREDYDWNRRQRRKRLLILSLIVITLVGLGTWGGTKIGGSNNNNNNNKEELALLQYRLTSTQSEYEALEESNTSLQSELLSLQVEQAKAQSQYNALLQDHDAISQDKETLQEQLALSEEELSQLQVDFDDLQTKLLSMTKLKGFDVDDTLRVSFATEEQFLSSRWIAGEITNIGSTTVTKAYIFIFRYDADGYLDKVDFPPILITNLGPDETAHFSFLSGGEAFKIMVAGNY